MSKGGSLFFLSVSIYLFIYLSTTVSDSFFSAALTAGTLRAASGASTAASVPPRTSAPAGRATPAEPAVQSMYARQFSIKLHLMRHVILPCETFLFFP